MKSLLFLSAIFVASFGASAVAEDCLTDDCKGTKAERKSPENYDDGNAFEGATNNRNPASGGETPYSDDEMQKNSPENFKTKNMPVDQD